MVNYEGVNNYGRFVLSIGMAVVTPQIFKKKKHENLQKICFSNFQWPYVRNKKCWATIAMCLEVPQCMCSSPVSMNIVA